jgi:aryl-alcohol dehydrogenase-like predicted oxidoreductase
LRSELALGLAALGRPGYLNLGHGDDLGADRSVAALERRTHAVLDAAWAGGVRWFDAARSYGRAEDFLGSWLRSRSVAADAVTVSSKWGYTYTAGWSVDAEVHEIKSLDADTFRRQIAETRARIGPWLSLYQIHSATLESGVLEDAAVLAELRALREGGVRVGLSTSGPGQPATILRALEVGGFDAVQATWNVLEPSAGEALASAHAAGLTVLVKEALANGRLAGRSPSPELAGRLGEAPDAVALAAALVQPWADVVLSGAATVAQLESNLRALAVSVDPSAFADLAEDPQRYWAERSALGWT